MTVDVVIAGAGIVGAACALELAEAGLKVMVVEWKIPGGGATAAGMGHIVAMDDSEAQFRLTRYSQTLWNELAPRLPEDAEHLPCGSLWVAADEEEMVECRRKLSYYNERGVTAQMLDERQLADAEPRLRRGLAGGLVTPEDSVVYPPCVTRYLLDRAKGLRALLITGKKVIAVRDGLVRLNDGSEISAGAVVNATGAVAPELTPGIDIQPRKGHLVITDRYPGFVRHQLIELGYIRSAHAVGTDSVAFNVQPRSTGQLLIGSSRQLGTFDPATEMPMLSTMLRRAMEYLPELAGVSAIRTWTGFRPATSDSLPLIGPCPGVDRVWLATGHEGLGITTSLATAKVLAAQILQRECAIPVEPYLPGRPC
ncbi:MAG: FAD-dependent oxidoreductase [Bryobacteraceae bacterium]